MILNKSILKLYILKLINKINIFRICDKTRMPNKDDLTKTTNNKQTFSSPSFIYPISSEFYNGRLFPLYNGYYPRLSISEILTKHHRNFFFNKLHYLTDEQLWKQTNPQPDQYWLSYIRSDPYAIGQSNYHHNEQRFHSNRPYHRSFLYNKLKSTISPPSMFFSRKKYIFEFFSINTLNIIRRLIS